MKFLLLVVALVSGAASSAAAVFERVCGGPDRDRGVYVSPTMDGGYIVVGATESFGAGNEDVYLVRADSRGEILWTRTFGGAEEDAGWVVHEVPGGFVLAGFTMSFGAGDFDFYLVKTDRDGERQWSRTFGGEGRDRCWSLALTDDGGFALAGETTSTGAGEEDFFLVRTDSLGTVLWSEAYGGVKGDRCFSVVQADDGGFMLAGQTYSEGAGDRDVSILKVSADGTLEWSRTFGGGKSDVGHSISSTRDGCFLVTGYTTSLAVDDDDPYLIKIDGQGTARWTRVLALEGSNHTLTGEQAADGGYFLVGFSRYRDSGTSAALVVKTDATGNLAWHEDILATSYGESFGYTVRATADGGCVFAGHTTTNSAGEFDLLLVGVDDTIPTPKD